MIDDDTIRLAGIFIPYFRDKRIVAKDNGQRFAHYTSAESAIKMLDKGEVWLRKSSVMNDFSEIEFGLSNLHAAWNSPAGLKLKNLLDSMFEGSVKTIENMFDQEIANIRSGTFLTCISEHDHLKEEHVYGRLSMWRAYGNVALVLSPDVFMRETTGVLQAYSNPVDYHTPQSFQVAFANIVANVENEFAYLQAQGGQMVWSWMLFMMRQMLICTKHKGFSEEKEWRIIHTPSQDKSPLIRNEIEVIRGVAQPVVKLKLQNVPEAELTGLDIPSFIERVIIGPTQHPWVQREAFATILEKKGVADPYGRIVISDIPLRQ